MARIEHLLRKGRWIEIKNPSPEDIDFLKSEFPFLHPLNLEDSFEPVSYAKMDLTDDYLFLALAVPVGLAPDKRLASFEVSMFLTRDALVTVARDDVPLAEEPERINSPQVLAYKLADRLYERSETVMAESATAIQSIDDRILSASSPSIIREIAILQRNLVHFSTSLETALPYFRSLAGADLKFDRARMKEYWNDLADRLARQSDALSDQEILLAALARAHEMFVTHRTNYIINVLTVFSAVFLPLNLIAGIYGMNFEHIPFSDMRYGFVGAVGFMVMAGLSLLAYFKWKRWI